MAAPQSSPRRVAHHLLDRITGEGRLMSELLAMGALDRLEPADRARAQRLTLDTLRGLERADRLLERHLRKNPPLTVRNMLRLATVEICMGGDAHGVVNEAVAIVGQDKRTGALKGLVNAVLRKIAAEGPAAWAKLRVPRLPKWLRGPLVEAYGAAVVADMEAVQFATPPLDLTARFDPVALAAEVGGLLMPTGSVRLGSAGQVTSLPGYDSGNWWVQDAGRQDDAACSGGGCGDGAGSVRDTDGAGRSQYGADGSAGQSGGGRCAGA